jgi:hypothetical protein
MRGQRIACIVVCPVLRDSASGETTIATDMELVVRVDNPTGPVQSDIGPLDSTLRGSVLNWTGATGSFVTRPVASMSVSGGVISASGQVCWCAGATWQAVAGAAVSCGADYLVIVTDSLASMSMIDTLAVRRASYNGFNVVIATVGQLDSTPDTLETPIAIRALIDSVYSSQSATHMSDGRLGYVLLVGDAFDRNRTVLLPSYYGYGSGHSNYAASDAYYSFLDDPVNDLLPDVLIGRLPVDKDATDWELTNVVRKIVEYEPLPAAAWTDSVLIVTGVDDANFTVGGEGLGGFQGFVDSALAYYTPPGKWVKQLHRLVLL